MSTATLVSLDEYWNTSYGPDMDFVDGALVRRNVGTRLHSLLQTMLAAYFWERRKSHRITVFTGGRLLVDAATRRYRVPDTMVVKVPHHKGKFVTDVPVIVVEIKSPEDTFDDIVDRCFDYAKRGVPNILVMDPDNRRAWTFEHGDLRLLAEPSVSLTLFEAVAIDFPWMEMFAALDEG